MSIRAISPRLAASVVFVFALVACGGGGGGGGSGGGSVTIPTPIGKRVIYTTDSDNSLNNGLNDEVWLVDLGLPLGPGVMISRDVPAGDQARLPIAFGTNGPFGYQVANSTGPLCRQELRLVPRAGGTTSSLFESGCLLRAMPTPNGTRVVFWHWDTATDDLTLSVSDGAISSIVRIDAPAGQSMVDAPALSPTGEFVFWADAAGIWSARVQDPVASVVAQLVSSTIAGVIVPSQTGAFVVYNTWGDATLHAVTRDGTVDTVLTNAIGAQTGSDYLMEFAVAADDAFVLYERVVAGDSQLWFVPVGAPLTEQRVDATYPIAENQPDDWAISPDGARFAWIGDDGTGPRVLVASAAAPTMVTALTPAYDNAYELEWVDATTLVVTAGNGGSALQSVSVNDPLNVVRIGPDETGVRQALSLQLCGDGTVLWMSVIGTGMGNDATLMRGTPLDALSAVQVAPTMHHLGGPFAEFSCVD